MNRFRTKRKGKDEGSSVPRSSQEAESSGPFRGFRKGKKAPENEQAPVDLATALPSNDDFRTSLLMTGLSARFSMLREQDDPNTKIGKASDDSVLYPKRQSRLDMGTFRGLGDIAEVESIKAPFARMDTYDSDDGGSVKAGSIMSRSKPTEGNNLFGGRQKIYKIPAGIPSSSKGDGGMGGRALYDDDVAQSAFQKWRKAEKERDWLQDTETDYDSLGNRLSAGPDVDQTRSTSPAPSSYNQKRETASTFSSTPSMARNSSAATSVHSQAAPSLKDWQPPSNSNGGGLERNVTRTRRLYETGFFNHDGQEPAPGVLSRVDTLNRQRPFGTRTPELRQHSPSPTTSAVFGDRLGHERKILTKASAPNLRSTSPPASASPTGTPDLGIRVPSAGETRTNAGGLPPLSPPISEADENSLLQINPNDRGKATALGVFQKPAQPYDESRFAQRQLELQRGRETPTQGQRRESSQTSQSRDSTSPPAIIDMDSPTAPNFSAMELPKEQGRGVTSFLADADDSDAESTTAAEPAPTPQVHLRRPSDRIHPALRGSALPTPLSYATQSTDRNDKSQAGSPADSPTLGPTTEVSGLSGMVRQHLRADSNASSIYGGAPPTAILESRFPTEPHNLQDYGAGSNPWDVKEDNESSYIDLDVNEPLPHGEMLPSLSIRQTNANASSTTKPDDTDDFARELADGARRIREKLTSYVETESRSSSPQRGEEPRESLDIAPLPRPSGLGSILRAKSSRGSLVERGRDPSSTRALKMIGLGSPAGSRNASPGAESLLKGSSIESEQRMSEDKSAEEPAPGLRAFRQARRDLQRLKEIESQNRHPAAPAAPQGPPPDIPSPQSRRAAGGSTTPIRDRQPPPVHYQQRMPSEESNKSNSPPESRYRSQSESSNDPRSGSRPAGRNRGDLAMRENTHLGAPGSMPRPPMRSPGLPGTNIKQSPFMPPQGQPNPMRLNQAAFASNGGLHVQRPRGYEPGQLSPISPHSASLTNANSAPPTPVTMASPPRPAVLPSLSYDPSMPSGPGRNDAMRPHGPSAAAGTGSSNGRVPPPLPPINPRRRQDSGRVQTPTDPHHPAQRRGTVSASEDDEPRPDRRRQFKPMGEGTGMPINFNRLPQQAPVNLGPPASRTVLTQNRSRSGNGPMPGGMI
ncbi:hypothetical protein GGR57DRAFT_300029 [Xylariaceae sp. FL1272]|nr:hypothetical protein GGR57DRAFT_300029 [Xylariaceae sp. FL1272]